MATDCDSADFAALLAETFDAKAEEDKLPVLSVRSYEEAAVLTCDAGFVVRMEDGSEFQVTVVRSK